MNRIMKNTLPYWKYIVCIFILLIIQAICDLSLPAYTSDIIDTGIQNGGFSHVLPSIINQEEYDTAQIFMTEEEINKWQSVYSKEGSYYKLNVTKEKKLDELDEIFTIPLIMNNQLRMSSNEGHNSREAVCSLLSMGMITKDDLLLQREEYKKDFDAMGFSLIKSMAVSFAKDMEEICQVDIKKKQESYLWISGLKMVCMAFLIAITSVMVGLLASKVGAGIGRDLRKEVFSNVIGFSNAEIDRFSTASLITRATNDVSQIQIVTILMLRMILYAPIIGIGGIIKVNSTKSGMGWIIVLAVAVIMSFVFLLMAIAMPKFKKMQSLIDNVNLVSREILTGLSVIRAFGREAKEEERFDEANKKLTKTMLFTNRTMTFMMPVMMLIMNSISILIVYVSAKRIDSGVMQVGSMTAFITYSMMIVMSFLMLTMMSVMLPRAIVAADRIDEVINTNSSISDPLNPKEMTKKQGVIEFKNVSFKYPGAKANVLQNISFTASPGETTAIIGSTGCGKSTLVNLIPRLFDVTEGSITIDGLDIRDVSMKQLRNEMSIVPQKAVLFSGTIESNIKFGVPDLSDKDMVNASKIAQADEFINEKVEKYESKIAQGGSNVSGGQKQRLSIARAIAKNPLVYIFDDSFSALDLKTDAALRKALSDITANKTVIIVAQRISTILNADQILVMEDGEIVGKGRHEELLRTCETYKQIATSQLSAKEIEETLSKGGNS